VTLNVVIVGITHWHAPRYVQMLRKRGAQLVGASDADAHAGAGAAARHGIDFVADTAALLDRARPDFAVVVPRHDQAIAQIRTVADRRIPMLVEKPMGRDANESRVSAEAIRRSGVFATLCFPNRHLEIWDVYRDLLAQDALGTVMHAHFRTINGPPARYIDYGVPWMLDPQCSGGGALRNLGIHGADAIATLAGDRALKLVGGKTTSIGHHSTVEDFAAGVFATEDGFIATLEAGYSYANMQEGGDYEWRIAATGAYLQETNGRLRVHKRGGALEERMVRTPAVAYEIMVNAALDAFEQGKPPPASADDCVRAVQLQDWIYAAATEG
jgi:predicted dehydrogenase